MKLNNKVSFYLFLLILSIFGLYKINAMEMPSKYKQEESKSCNIKEWVSIENNTGHNLQLVCIYGFTDDPTLSNIILSTPFIDKTHLDLSKYVPYSPFIKKKLLKSCKLQKIAIKNEGSSDSLKDKYLLEIPVDSNFIKGICITLHTINAITGTIQYQFTSNLSSANLENRILKNIFIKNDSGNNILVRRNMIRKLRFKEYEINLDGLLCYNYESKDHEYNMKIDTIFKEHDQAEEKFILKSLKVNLASDLESESQNYYAVIFLDNNKSRDNRNWVEIDIDKLAAENKDKSNSVIITLKRKEKSSGTLVGKAFGLEWFGGPVVYLSDVKYLNI